MNPGPKHPEIKLVGEDGNAFAIIGRVQRAMRRAHVPPEELDEFLSEAMSGDYSNVLMTAMRWVEVT
jgi:hypothetical protein